jgi:hypothetical protein
MEFLPVFSTYFIKPERKKIGTTDVHKNLSIVIFVKLCAGKAVLFVWALIKLHLHVYRKTVWHSESKVRLGKICAQLQGVHQLQSCFIICTIDTIYFDLCCWRWLWHFLRSLDSVKPQWFTLWTNSFNIHKIYVLPTQCMYVFCVDLRTNSDYFPIQY